MTLNLKKRSALVQNKMFTDKSYANYQRIPDFAEIVAISNKFEKVLKMKVISFTELEQALDLENENHGRKNFEWTRSDCLKKLYVHILVFFGHSMKDFNNVELNSSIFALLNKWKNDFKISSDILKASDMCELSATQKLQVIDLMLNQALNTDKAHRVIETLDVKDLRIQPFVVDKSGNKLWYFSDTYLFLESEELPDEPPLKKSDRRKSTVVVKIENNFNLFTGNSFKIICRTSDDWLQLIEAYKKKKDRNAVDILLGKYESIRSLEQKRLKDESRISTTVRTSSRIQLKIEQRKKQEENEKRQREDKRTRYEATNEQLLLERQHTSAKQQKIINEVLLERHEKYAASREKRLLQREQRKFQQLSEKNQLIQKFKKYDCNNAVSCSKQNLQFAWNCATNTEFCNEQNSKAFSKKKEELNDWFALCKMNKQNDTSNDKQFGRLLDQYLKPSLQNHSKERCRNTIFLPVKEELNPESVCSKFVKNSNNVIDVSNKSIQNTDQHNTQMGRLPNIIVKKSFSTVVPLSKQAPIKRSIITSSNTNLANKPMIIMPSPNTNVDPPVYCLDKYGQLQRVVRKSGDKIIKLSSKHVDLPNRGNEVIFDGIYDNIKEGGGYITASPSYVDSSQYANRFKNMRPSINSAKKELHNHQTYQHY